MEKNKKIRFTTLIYSLIVLVIIFVFIFGTLNYVFEIKNNFIKITNKILPFPAALVNFSNLISINALDENLAATRRFYENQDFSSEGLRVDFETADGEKRLKIKEKNILNKMIENIIIEKLAKERGIKLTDEFVAQEVERKLIEFGSAEEVKNNLMKLYGWDIEKFKEKIVKPEMYKEKLAESVLAENSDFEDAKKKIEAAYEELSGNKKFEDVALKYSDGESAKSGGDLGWFNADQMLPQISLIAFQLEKGKYSQIIQSSLGFHIIKIENKKTENDIQLVHVRQIFVRTPSFADWLVEKEKSFSIKIFLKDFKWDPENQQVQFTNIDLKKFEENLLENSAGDASVIF